MVDRARDELGRFKASGNVRVVVGALERFTTGKIKAIVLDATANLVEDTPRDTGWARANWIPSIGKPFDGVDGSKMGVSVSKQQAGIAEVATQYKLSDGKVFVSNNVPYIQRLNDGSSSQAPSGFVQAAILKAVRDNE